ncbi:MAG TPA: LacI family DNA-binding transcriptional regulator [Arachnia sp.]|nr:LacI family DNA-binding transcriptional regulator [Arachnia sp.]HMT84748.1 LacI family DNA-binding transcriptional regulator [Arachnia sp.]
MVTMQDVARHAGVSVMTVSNVVNDHPHVRKTTREKVVASIEELGYRVNTTARSLRQGRTGVIGLALPEIDRPYFGLLSALLIERARQYDYDIVVEQTGARRENEMDAILHSRLRSYDGLLLHASQLAQEDAALLRGDFPIVVLGERAYSAPVDHVVMDNEQGATLAARHLIDRGCTRIAMIGGRPWSPGDVDVATMRTKGFVAEIEAAGLELGPGQVQPTRYNLADSRDAVGRLLKEVGAVDGIFCATDWVAFGVLRGLADAGLRVPEDVRIVGFDDVPQAAFSTPSLSSIAPDHEAMADAALKLLVGRIAGERPRDDFREVFGAVRLIPRESSA